MLVGDGVDCFTDLPDKQGTVVWYALDVESWRASVITHYNKYHHPPYRKASKKHKVINQYFTSPSLA